MSDVIDPVRAEKPEWLRVKKSAEVDVEKGKVHVIRKNVVCETEERGYATPQNRDRHDLVLDVPGGVVRLWAMGTKLNWRFQERSLEAFENPEAVKAEVRRLLAEAVLEWGDAVPVTFVEDKAAWDFEIVVQSATRCSVSGCVLASAFFPDSGRHQLVIYPTMFEQSRDEQIATMVHELGHVFGLRHFFALTAEKVWPSVVFGTHDRFTIMNYGDDSRLTKEDRSDLKNLYYMAWSGKLTHINGTPIQFVSPYHTTVATSEQTMVLSAAIPNAVPQVIAAATHRLRY